MLLVEWLILRSHLIFKDKKINNKGEEGGGERGGGELSSSCSPGLKGEGLLCESNSPLAVPSPSFTSGPPLSPLSPLSPLAPPSPLSSPRDGV